MPHLKGAYVVRESEALQSGLPGGLGTGRETINRAIGCRNLVQRVLRYLPGTRGESLNPAAEEVLFVLQGRGEAVIGGAECALRPDMGVLVPPGVRCRIASHGPGELVLLSAVSPQPGQPPGRQAEASLREDGKLWVSVDEEEDIPVGEERRFKLLIDPRYGCRSLTQFVGYIERSRAPFHSHTYEEVIYIVSGKGVVHVDDESHPIGRGTCIYLPPGLAHCLENTGDAPLTLVGTFCPAGDPGSKKEG